MIELTAGFMPLTDSAILVIAKEQGFAEAENIALELVRESSWATVRDRLAVGQFEIAHALAPMPLAANLGLTPFDVPMIAPMALGLGGNAITVSTAVFEAMQAKRAFTLADAKSAGLALFEVVQQRNAEAKKPLQFGVVHAFSVHNFELRYWLAASGVMPERDIEITVLPPQLMAAAMEAGQIDGFCVGEPWNSVAVDKGIGKIATIKAAIWASSPEKVLAMRAKWAADNAEAVSALLRALYYSAAWCADPANIGTLSAILAKPQYIGQSDRLIARALTGTILEAGQSGSGLKPGQSFFEPHARAATFPWQSHALWLYSQMVRWNYVTHQTKHLKIAEQSFRPDLYRAALAPIGVAVPAANSKVEGALKQSTAVGAASQSLFLGPDGFFDETLFDPDHIEAYIAAQK